MAETKESDSETCSSKSRVKSQTQEAEGKIHQIQAQYQGDLGGNGYHSWTTALLQHMPPGERRVL